MTKIKLRTKLFWIGCLLLLNLVIYGGLKFYIFKMGNHQHRVFQVGRNHIKYHANKTQKLGQIIDIDDLHTALDFPSVSYVDISFAMSELQYDDLVKLLPSKLKPYQTLKLNFENLNLGIIGGQYILFLIQNGIEELQLEMDFTRVGDRFSRKIANKINQMTSVRKLQLSLSSSGISDIGVTRFLSIHKIHQQLKYLRLSFESNTLTKSSLKQFPNYTQNSNLHYFSFDLFNNSLGSRGVRYLSVGLQNLQVSQLDINLQLNKIDENGVKVLCGSIGGMKNLVKLSLDLDYNEIDDKGCEYLGGMFRQLPQLQELEIGLVSNSFGVEAFEHMVEGLSLQKQLQVLTMRLGENRLKLGGVRVMNKLFEAMTEISVLKIGIDDNALTEIGFEQLAENLVSKLPKLTHLFLDVRDNEIQGEGTVNAIQYLANKFWNVLHLKLSNNGLNDADIKLMLPHLVQLLKNSNIFILQLMDTSISRVMMRQISKLFRKNGNKLDKISVNSIIPQSEQQLAEKNAKEESQKTEQVNEEKPQKLQLEKTRKSKFWKKSTRRQRRSDSLTQDGKQASSKVGSEQKQKIEQQYTQIQV